MTRSKRPTRRSRRRGLIEARARSGTFVSGHAALGAEDSQGNAELRASLAAYLRALDIEADVGSVVVTSGSQQSISLVVRALVRPGDRVVVEDPSRAGAWQWSPLKARCVGRCRSPLGFMLNEWRDGPAGALAMGLRYAAWCVGCCWMLMLVLFVAGAMSFGWAAAISCYVLTERLLPVGRTFDRVTGAMLAAWGVWLIAQPLT